jgi:hypothetical protein
MPLAEEAVMLDRFDQAATVSRAAIGTIDSVPDAGIRFRTQTLETAEQVLEMLLAHTSARRGLTDIIEQIYQAATSAIGAGHSDAFQDACSALLPVAQADPGRWLVRAGVVRVGNGDEPDRPLEHLALRLDALAESVWGPGGTPISNPRTWVDVAQGFALGLAQWIGGHGRQPSVESLMINVMASMARVGMYEAAAGRGEGAWLTYSVLVDIALMAHGHANFSEATRAASRQLAFIGLEAEASGATVPGGSLAADIAAAIAKLPASEIAWLKSEIPSAGEFIRFRGSHAGFLGRLP